MNVSEVIIKALEQLGIKRAFGIPGGTIANISNALAQSQIIKTTHTHHEGGAAYIALGRSLIVSAKNQEMGLCFGCSGPGTTNLITGIASAYEERLPLFVLTGNIATKFIGKGAAQDNFESGINALKMLEPITAQSICLTKNTDVATTVKMLYETALNEKRPVHLNVPLDIAAMQVADKETQFEFILSPSKYSLDVDMQEAIQRFLQTERPLLFCGNGIKTSSMKELMSHFISESAIPAIATSHAKGIFSDEQKYYFGNFGFAANTTAKDFLTSYKPDAILFLGTRLGEVATEGWSELLNQAPFKIHVDHDANQFNRNYKVDYGIKADLVFFMQQLIAATRKNSSHNTKREKLIAQYFVKPNIQKEELVISTQTPINPKECIQVLNKLLPDNAFIFSDIGNSMAWLLHDFKLKNLQDFYVPVGLGAMGSSICMSVGAKSALEERPVICITGDCSMLMHGMEIFTAKRAKCNVKFIILNDGGHGMVNHGSKLQGLKCDDLLFDDYCDFTKLGDLFGIKSYSVNSLQKLSQLPLENIFNSDEPIIIDLVIDRSVLPPIASRLKALNQT